jgi:hypothetical protein
MSGLPMSHIVANLTSLCARYQMGAVSRLGGRSVTGDNRVGQTFHVMNWKVEGSIIAQITRHFAASDNAGLCCLKR